VQCYVTPLVAERRWLSSDVGRAPLELARDFPRFRDALLRDDPPIPDEWWWEGSEVEQSAAVRERLELQARESNPLSLAGLRFPWQPPQPAAAGVGDRPALRGVALAVEPYDAFASRIEAFRVWLAQHVAQAAQATSPVGDGGYRVLVVAHWGVLYTLLGSSVSNCEAVEIGLGDLLARELTVMDD